MAAQHPREPYEGAARAARSARPAFKSRPTGLAFEIGDCVEVFGLESETGRPLNGRTGVVSSYTEETGRFQVRFGLEKEVALKPSNLRRPELIPGDCVEVSGLESESGRLLNGQKGHITRYVEAADCYDVCFEPERMVNLKPENLCRPPLGVADSVEVVGLESEGGKALNGRKGVVTKFVEDAGRFQVQFLNPEKLVNLKPENLTRGELGPGDAVEVSGLESESGKLLNGQRGVITRHCEASDRFEVRFKLVSLGAANLTKVDAAFGPGDGVLVSGLPPESGGKALNGQRGLVTQYLKDSGMFQVRFGPNKAMGLQAKYLQKFGPSPGEQVEVSGLTSESGRQLNGQRGVVVTYVEEAGRFQVRFGQDKVVNLKAENLGAFTAI